MIVLISSIVDLIVPVLTPDEFDAPPCTRVLLVPLTVNVGETPEIGFPFASFRVMVTEAEEEPSAFTGVDVSVRSDLDAEGAPATNVAVAPTREETTGEARVMVLASAVVEVICVLNFPLESVFPVDRLKPDWAFAPLMAPLALKLTVCPVTGLLLASSNVNVTDAAVVPSAVSGVGLVTAHVDVAAEGLPATNSTAPPDKLIGLTNAKVLVSAFLEVKLQVLNPAELVALHAL